MKTITENVKNAFKQPTTKRKGRILVNGTYYDIYNVNYYADCYDEGRVIGNAIASQLDFDIPYMPKFDTFQYFDAIYVNNSYEYIDYGTFTVFDEKDQDEFNKHITAFDNLIKFNVPFEERGSYPKSLYDELSNICNQANVTLANLTIPNGTFVVENNQFTNGESLKTVLKQICSISGTYAVVKNNNLYLQLKNTTSEELNKSQHEPIDWKRRSYGINQVIIGDSQIEGEYVIRQDDADIALNGAHKLEILDNLFANTQEKRSALIDGLYNQVHGFGYIPFEMKGEWLSYLEVGDTVNIDGVSTMLLRINAKSPDSLNTTMSAPAIIDSSIEYVNNTNDVNNRMKLTERTVDKQNQVITDVVSNVTEQNTKISTIEQTVNEINAKISDIADITTSAEDTDAQVELNEINQSEPVQIKVHPLNENISYLYPSTGLFPSENTFLKVRTIKFFNTETDEEFYYEIPEDLLYYDSENYDEFIMDYGDGESTQGCQVIKRCEYNADGTVRLLETPETHSYPYPTGEQAINLTDGNYVVSLLGYTYAYIFVRLMAKNIYTTQFYTKAETNTLLSETAQGITANVNQKFTNYSTTSEMDAAINIKAEQITTGVSSTYETKTDATNKLNAAKGYTDDELENYSTTTEMATAINQGITDNNTAYVDIEVAKKVNNTDYTHAQIVAKINDNTSQAQINADKVDIAANDVLNILAGNTIDLTSKNITIDSINFQVDSDGNVYANNGEFNGVLRGNSGSIGGWGITNNGISTDFGFYINHAENVSSQGYYYNVGVSNIYTISDYFICQAIINGTLPTPVDTTTKMFRHYDLNGDGVIDVRDLLTIAKIIGIY